MESYSNTRSLWRPYESHQQCTTTCLQHDFSSPPSKRMRVFYTEEQRQVMNRIYEEEVQADIKQQVCKDLKAKRKQIQEYFRKQNIGARRRKTKTRGPQAAHHAIPARLTNTVTTWTITTPVTHPTVTKTTNHQPSSRILNESRTRLTNRPTEPIVESCCLDSIVLVPFFRIPSSNGNGDCSDDDYRYVSAAKILGFYRIQ